ncbi:uncharacterized protein LOC128858017 [Anastrepha ludens]|uniref:uncharacterized protein LOC128858017 n=1 Tax=Anastrepha ludens TaxID=28586 RepID=UPI0023B1AAB9|nr:uncharacterized protein LOC128858017 [Anastrepha ludens]
MSQSISATPPMHDISLSGTEEHGDSAFEVQKTVGSKANSLKRFFKLSNRRHSASEEQPTSSSEVVPEDRGQSTKDEVDKEASRRGPEMEDELEKPRKDHPKRFHLRLGAASRIVEPANTGNFVTNASSRQSLKNSISSYWHTVFRRASKRVGKQKVGQNCDEEDDVEVDANERQLEEEVQTLSISEDTVGQVIQAIE